MATGIPIAITSNDPQTAVFLSNECWLEYCQCRSGKCFFDSKETVDTKKIKRIFFVNAGLDVGYVIGGILLSRNGSINNDPQQLVWQLTFYKELFCVSLMHLWAGKCTDQNHKVNLSFN